MKLPLASFHGSLLAGGLFLAVAWWGGAPSLYAAAKPAPAPPKPAEKPATNAPAVAPQLEIPLSVFVWKTNAPGFGRDPFFPDSERFKPKRPPKPTNIVIVVPGTSNQTSVVALVTTPPVPARPEVPLVLQGIIGNKLAVINGRNFMSGDAGMVAIPSGKIRIRCEAIQDQQVKVTIFYEDKTTEEKTLSLRSP
jgi:hypothetical protein